MCHLTPGQQSTNSRLVIFMFLQLERSSLIVLSLTNILFSGNSGGGLSGLSGNDGRGSSDDSAGEGEAVVGSDDGGVVDDVVGGVGGGPGVNGDLGDVVDLVMDLVSDQTGLGDQVGVDGLVDGGSGDSLDSGDVVDHGGDDGGDD